MTAFPLAPMNRLVIFSTALAWLLPLGFFASTFAGVRLVGPAVGLVVLYAWVWLRMRPSTFIVHADALEVRWPWKRRRIPRDEIGAVHSIDRVGLRDQVGWGLRVGVGGLWGAFGWLWTTRRGIVQMYVSRTDGFVWIEQRGGRPWLISPASPDEFIAALTRTSRVK